MTPVEIGQGKSFKGLAAYLLHDERQTDDQTIQSAERVGWVKSFNLGDADGEQAWRRMLATANSANALKEAAGIKKGRAVKNTVHHYSLNFHPDDDVTPALIQKAVAESLAVYGMEHHEALAVEHTDKAHRHVHVMVNLIDPENGMSAASPQKIAGTKSKRSKLSNSQRKLSAWAGKFERDNRLHVIDGRLENANKRMQGEDVDASRKARNVEDRKHTEDPTDRRRDMVRDQFKDRAAAIQQKTRELKEQCATEWAALKEGYADEKEQIRKMMSPMMRMVSASVKNDRKADWRTLFRKQQAERFHFDRDSKKAIHRVWYGAVSVREMVRQGKHFKALTAAFSTTQQRDIMMMRQDKERAALAREIKAEIQENIDQIKKDFDRQFGHARERFKSDCSELKERQDESWEGIKSDWKAHNAERKSSLSRQRSQERAQTHGRHRGMRQTQNRTPT